MAAHMDLPNWGTDSSVAVLNPLMQVFQSPETVVHDNVPSQRLNSSQVTVVRPAAIHFTSDNRGRQQHRTSAHSERRHSRHGPWQRGEVDCTSVHQPQNREDITDRRNSGPENISEVGGREPPPPAGDVSPSRLEDGLGGGVHRTRYLARSYDHDDLLMIDRHRRRRVRQHRRVRRSPRRLFSWWNSGATMVLILILVVSLEWGIILGLELRKPR